jgi:LacI family transcriptional regulator
MTDNFGAAYDATRHLLELGHQRVAIIIGRLDLPIVFDRLEGFRHSLQEAHLPLREEYFRRGDSRVEGGYQCGLELMQLLDPPTAIFSCLSRMTLGLMRALYDLRIPCPARVSVVGFDDCDWAANFNPRLTMVAQPSLEIGKQATQMLLRKIKPSKQGADGKEEKVVVLKAELRVRDSTAAPF